MDRPQGPLHAPSRSGDPGASVRLTVCLLALLTFFIPVVRAAEPVKLNLWNIPPSWCWDPERKSQYKIFRRFLDLNPDIEVEQGQGLTILGPASQSSFLMAMAGGIAPDCFPTSLGNLPGYVEQGLVMPLDEFYAAWPDKDRIPQMFIDAATIDGRLYGIVVNTGALALIYRKDFFEDVGLDPDRPPQDWDELVKYSAMLTDPDQGRFGFGCRPEEIFINFLWQAGGDIVRKRPDGTLEAALDTPEAAKALAFVKRLKFEGHMRLPTQAFGASNDMAEGKVAMVYARPETDYQYLLSKLQEYQIGITALPAGPAGRVTAVGGEVWCINGTLNPKNPDERRRIEAAWRYISFLASREAARIRTQTYVERNGAEFLSPADLREFGFEYAVERIDPSLRDLHENIYKYGRVEPVFPGITEVGVIMRAPIEAVLADPNADPAGEMKAANDRINREVFVRRRGKTDVIKERIAVGVAALLGVLFIVFFVKALRAVAEKVRSETRVVSIGGASMRRRKHTVAWLLMLPALGSIALWSYIPLARGSVMAFQDYLLVGGGSFSGLRNFIDVFTNPMFYTVLFNTFYYVLLTLAIGFGIPIFLAILLAEVPRGKVLFRVLFFLPAVTSGLVIMFLWRWFYDPTEAGLFNTLLMQAGAIQNPIGWLQDRRLAMLCIILPGVWAGAGPGSIIYIAALKSVPNEIYEAADVDGAGTIRKVFHITLPYLKALIIINFVGAFIGAFHAMQGIFVMTGGGPENSTYTIGLDIYYNAFVYLRFGYATALAWVLGSMLIGFTMYQLRILKHVKFEAAKGE